jgi:hypothetical protein
MDIMDQYGNDLTLQTNTVIVGQQMNLTCQILYTNSFFTNNFVVTNFQWTVPGYALTNWYTSSDRETTNGYPIPLSATNGQTVRFFWVNGSTNINAPLSYTVHASATVNGFPVTGVATFNVVKPMARIFAQTSVVALGWNINASSYGLFFGTNLGQAGITFSNTAKLPPGTNYNHGDMSSLLCCWQVIDPPYESEQYFLIDTNAPIVATNIVGIPIEISTNDGLTLDGTSPYGFVSYPIANDSPGVRTDMPYEVGASMSQYSRMWLMFKPDGGNFVPVRAVDWFCSGSATNRGSGWVLTSRNWSVNPQDIDPGTSYPTWTNSTYYYGISH